MDRIIDPADVKERLKTLREDRGITSRMRTHLRRLIVTELRGLPRMQLPQGLSVRARAVACLLVEWLQSYHCHYSLSVLVSELPGLADLPRLAGSGDVSKFQTGEVEEILSALDIKCDEILDSYASSGDCLLACLLKVLSEWRGRLEFREFHVTLENEKEERVKKLKDLLTGISIKPEKLPFLFGALNRLIDHEVEVTIASERKNLAEFMAQQEKKIQEQFRAHEDQLKKRLLETGELFNQDKKKLEEELQKKQNTLEELAAEVQRQHRIVINNLKILEVKSKQLEAEKQAFQEKLQNSQEAVRLPEIRKSVYQIESPVSSLTSSEDSVEFVKAARRIKLLGEETKNARLESQAKFESSQSEESSQRFIPSKLPKQEMRVDSSRWRSSRSRYEPLLMQEEESPEASARRELIQKSSQLEQLIAWNQSPKKMQEIRDKQKLDMLMECVRSIETPRTFLIHSPIHQLTKGDVEDVLPPIPAVGEILKVHQEAVDCPAGVTQLALADGSDLSDGEVTAGRVSPASDNFWA